MSRARTSVIAAMALAAAGCGGSGQPGRDVNANDPRVLAQLMRHAQQRSGAAGITTPAMPPATQVAPAKPRAQRHPRRPPRPAGLVPKPPIDYSHPIPFGSKRRAETRAYALRHYGRATARLHPRLIVEHYTETTSFQATYAIFAPDTPDVELHELPNVCAHFVVDRDGHIYALVPLRYMCRHTVGLNDRAIGIENVGMSDAQVLGDPREMRASLALSRWLRCRYRIHVSDVIGHNESLSSSYHHERVPSLRRQTHSDFSKADMDVYRRRLRALGGCGG